MLQSVLWKEWREQRWKAAFGAVMLGSFTASLAAARLTTPREVTAMVTVLGGLIMALYSAMGVFAPERSHRTLPFLVALPVPAWQVFACKWGVGWLSVAVPILASGVCLAVFGRMASGEALAAAPRFLIESTAGCLVLGTTVYTWVCCLTVRRTSEAAVGLAGLLLLVLFLVHLSIAGWTGVAYVPMGEPTLLRWPVTAWIATLNPLLLLVWFGREAWPAGGAAYLVAQGLALVALMTYGFRCWRRSL